VTPELQAVVERLTEACAESESVGATYATARTADVRTLLAAVDPAEQQRRPDYTLDSTDMEAALTAEPLTLRDTDAIRRTRDYLAVHLRVHGPEMPIATINESTQPGGFLWKLTPADLGRTLVPANRHITYKGMQALRHQPLTDEPSGVIPTPAGLNYLATRRQQHPRETPS
jgi:hypothetical protein